jgi:hypothetical protein
MLLLNIYIYIYYWYIGIYRKGSVYRAHIYRERRALRKSRKSRHSGSAGENEAWLSGFIYMRDKHLRGFEYANRIATHSG